MTTFTSSLRRAAVFTTATALLGTGLGATVMTPAEAATYVHVVNHTDGNVWLKTSTNGKPFKVASGHTSKKVKRSSLIWVIYKSNIYGVRGFGDGKIAYCEKPGEYKTSKKVNDGPSNQLLADGNCQKKK